MKRWAILLITLALGLLAAKPASAQGQLYSNTAWLYSPAGAFPAPGAVVTICTISATGQPCTPTVTVYQDSALSMPVVLVNGGLPPCSTSPQVGCIDGFGNFSFYAAPGAYSYTITGSGINPYGPIPIGLSCTAGVTCVTSSGNNAFTGSNTQKNSDTIRYIDPGNPQGWSGSDLGAWVNAAFANCVSAGTGCPVQIAAGTYNFSTPIVITQEGSITCPGGPDNTTVLNYTPATGIAITINNSNTSFAIRGCKLETSTSTTSQGIVLQKTFQPDIVSNHINGFNGGGIIVTGDGVSGFSTEVHIDKNLVDGYCGSGSFGIEIDHTIDAFLNGNAEYTTNNCATATAGVILDTGAGGIWLSQGTNEQGISGLLVRSTNQGGSYGGSPAAIWFMGHSVGDTTPGGSTIVFDSTLGSNAVRFRCSECWSGLAGWNNIGSIVTSSAIGIDIEGGSDISFTGGVIRQSAGWGVKINTPGSDISFTGTHVLGSNQANTANVGSILVTANPKDVTFTGVTAGNSTQEGGNSTYGLDVSAVTASQNVMWCGNDLAHNNTARIHVPALGGLGVTTVDAPECGGVTGQIINGFARMDAGPLAFGTLAGLSGTGACATLSSQNGGEWDGEVTCGGTTGASTLTITPGTTAPNHWECHGSDTTSGHELALPQSGLSATTCTIKASSVTSGDVLSFSLTAH